MIRKTLLTAFVFLVLVQISFSQACDTSIFNPALDMRKELYQQIGVVTRSYKTITGTPGGDVKYSEEKCNGVADGCDYSGSALVYDVYYPLNHDYQSCALPAIFLFHGGGYTECAGYEADQMVTLATEMAKRGFVAFNVEYRRGVLLDDNNNIFTAQQMLAVYRAAQDARGAVRSGIRRQEQPDVYKEPYSIDTNNIFIGGMSAGSLIAMTAAYYQQQSMFDEILPGMKDALGSVNENYYLGDTTISYKIRGVLNLWGANIINKKGGDASFKFFQANSYMPPMVAFAGEQDQTFNYQEQPLYLAAKGSVYPGTTTPLNSENRCTLNGVTYDLNSSFPNPDGELLGSEEMYSTLQKYQQPTELYLDENMGHGLSPKDSANNNYTGFGIGSSDPDTILAYIAQRGATFFQAHINGFASKLGKTMFEDCENYRYANHLTDSFSCSSVLPVKLLAFNAAAAKNTVIVSWQATNETQGSYYVAEKSSDGKTFVPVKQVSAIGNGSAQSYSVTDNQPYSGKSYYRLKEEEANSNAVYSSVILVDISDAMVVTIRPNPVKDVLNVGVQAKGTGTTTIQILDNTGRVVLTREIASTGSYANTPITVAGFASGMYYLKVIQGKDTHVSKWIKE